MDLRRLGTLSAALLTAAALTACSAEVVEADDAKPSAAATGSTSPSGAPGGGPAKADRDPTQWMPPAGSATCTYLVDWAGTQLRWGLSADDAERTGLLELAEPCTDSVVEFEPAA
ncbi:hypothetical protein NJO91_15975 [Streptomyces microflavus]|uniref:hypothetical protein n=1 Tax=Streptomyces microflavus TaxID=1919 RepID=UPI0029B2AF76|nr:hypothetical protein [Streptomyces microflavus]MDX2404612.1 hypothetical protein [Streptomyces microflavus]